MSGTALSASPARRLYQVIALAYLACLSWMLLAPDPWILFGENADQLADTAHRTLADHFQHAIAFLLLAILSGLAWRPPAGFPLICHGSLLLSYATGSEGAQAWIPQRQFEWTDMAANLAGVTLGLLLARLLFSSSSRAAGSP